MLLRASGQTSGTALDLSAVHGTASGDGGIEHGARLVAFTEAVMREDPAAIERERRLLRALLSPEAFVDTCATIGAFNVVDRVADATGIPLDDPIFAMTGDLRAELRLARFASSANTPGARAS